MRRRPKTSPQRVGDILQSVLNRQRVTLPPLDRSLRQIWNRAVGDQIAAQTFPESIRRGVLYVRVANSAWMQQLQFLKAEVLGKFNALSGREPASSLRFVIGEIPSAGAGKAAAAKATPLAPRDRNLVESSLQSVADPELKSLLQRVMTKEIRRRRERPDG